MRRRDFIRLVACGAAGSLPVPWSLAAGASPMTIIDSQVHAYEANTAKRPWHTVPNWPDHVTGDEMVAALRTDTHPNIAGSVVDSTIGWPIDHAFCLLPLGSVASGDPPRVPCQY